MPQGRHPAPQRKEREEAQVFADVDNLEHWNSGTEPEKENQEEDLNTKFAKERKGRSA